MDENSPQPSSARPNVFGIVCGAVGLACTPITWWAIQPLQFNVIHYKLELAPGSPAPTVFTFSLFLMLFPYLLAAYAARYSAYRSKIAEFLRLTGPMIALLPLGVYALASKSAGVALSLAPPWNAYFGSFDFVVLALLGVGATAYRSGRHWSAPRGNQPGIAVASLLMFIALCTVMHFKIQENFFNHFMFGHADIGHFTEELKNALAGRGLRSDSFDNTRLGWHFVPLMFVLVPGYAVWPSIHFLMVLGPLVLHLAALPVFWFVRRRTSSVPVSWLCAVAWLLLPSLSRLVYSNTYGFAWLYTAVPLAALLIAAALLERWRLCWLLVAVLLLSRETHTAVTLGFGVYLALFTSRRRAGLVVMAVSVAYALLCAEAIIPYFAKAARYERLDMFGELGGSVGALALSAFIEPDIFFGRLIRPQSINFVLLLLATMCFLPLRGWRVAVAALPSILVHLLLEGTDWISIKFWHHAMVLPVLFMAALSKMDTKPPGGDDDGNECRKNTVDSRNLGIALALVTCAAWGHYFFGFSPFSKSYEVYAHDPFLQNPDPRLAFIDRLRSEIPRDHTILATERAAAHFIEYKRLYTGRRSRLADFVVLDRSDAWDSSCLPQRAAEFAANPDYQLYAESGPVIVFARRADAAILHDD